jgi:ABC-type glucose/galactose transport system permease subunit
MSGLFLNDIFLNIRLSAMKEIINIECKVKIRMAPASVFGHRSSVSYTIGIMATGIIAYNHHIIYYSKSSSDTSALKSTVSTVAFMGSGSIGDFTEREVGYLTPSKSSYPE